MSTVTNEADEIRRQMATIRHDLHQDVQGVVATAEKVADWTRYFGKYPWLSLGVAFGVGYFIVPKRHPSSALPAGITLEQIRDAVGNGKAVTTQTVREEKAEKAVKKGLVGAALGMLWPIAFRAAQGYALKYAEAWIAQQAQGTFAHDPTPSPAGPPPARERPR